MTTVSKNTYLETFTNSCGENWWFDYNEVNDMGIIWCDDYLINGNTFHVFDGIHFLGLVLGLDETRWLKQAWNKYSKKKNIYLDLNTEIKTTKKYTSLTNGYCPICLKQKDSFEIHHCIPSSEGGSDDYVNMLHICISCHALITNGCLEDRFPRYKAALDYKTYLHGIDFYKMNPLNNKRHKDKSEELYKNRLYFKNTIEYYEKLSKHDKGIFNNKLKETMLYSYKFYRSVVRGFIDYKTLSNLEDSGFLKG